MSFVMKSTSVAALLFLSAAVLVSCAPPDEKLGGRISGGRDGWPRSGRGATAEQLGIDIAQRDLDLSHHAIAQLALARRQVETAVSLKLIERMAASASSKIELGEKSCRTLWKDSPDFNRSGPARSERFSLAHRCTELGQAAQTKTASAELRGTERYLVSYDENLPVRGENYEVSVLAPVAITVQALNLEVNLKPWNDDKTGAAKYDFARVSRVNSLVAERVDANESTLTYRVFSESKNNFFYDIKFGRRMGDVSTLVSDAIFQVDRKTRAVTLVSVEKVSLRLFGEAFQKKDVQGRSLARGPRYSVELNLRPTGALLSSSLVCGLPEGAFKLTKKIREESSEAVVQFKEGKLTMSSRDMGPQGKSVGACDQSSSGNPVMISEYEGVYL